ncbi:DNA primase [Spirilliplanes yamanashiensis]|uniref:Uncharacterized protein n=1 Tax=Spirilliplanes yamanashiensis TaxID=42233 RepID=A0A8J3Y3C7_9ACTN|nr:DNA primase [Spirilliplanes yamanashiensis]MDP9814173.1 hypothetical protein [Spirilliplanes yamanashiensis]GIJ00845.1 hypothetical protein Sya03_01970 [Spirilliplanes yamanashiensis]
MARQPSEQPTDADEVSSSDVSSADGADRALWEQTRVTPVEIALPGGVGFTLRAYRMSDQLAGTEVAESDEDDVFDARARAGLDDDEDDEEVVILDEEYKALVEGKDSDADEAAEGDEPAEEEFHDEEKEPVEEVPFFLTHKGKLLVFKSPESLVSFVRSGAPHDLTQLDTWPTLAERITVEDVVVDDEDSYELDLVVENLRGGHDTWDNQLLIEAGEIARDLAYALRIKAVVAALSPGTPLDDLDESLRSAAKGGLGGFRGRRRLRKIGAQQASIGWRTIIGKISASVDWRD